MKVLLALLAVSSVTFGQTKVDQGRPGNQGPWAVYLAVPPPPPVLPSNIRLQDGDGALLTDVFAVGDAIGAVKAPMCMVSDGVSARALKGDATGRLEVLQSGTWTVQQGTPPWSVVGNKTNNAAVPGATNVGVLPAVATAAAPTYIEGNQVTLSTDLMGAIRTATTPSQCSTSLHTNTVVGAAAASTPAAQLAGRRYVTLCNSLQNAGVPQVKCRVDGVAPVFSAGNAGDVLGLGDCVQYTVSSTVVPSCIASGAGTNVTSYECL